MSEKLISHANLEELLCRLTERGNVYAPLDAAGESGLRQWQRHLPIALAHRNFLQSPKRFFLPQTETLLRFKDTAWVEAPLEDRETFLFGVRPCDARALTLLDKVFLDGERPDPYYRHHREKTVVMALACSRPQSSCFCTSVRGGPGDASGADVLAVNLDAELLLTPQTAKGRDLMTGAADLLADSTPAALRKAADRIGAVEEQIPRVKIEGSAGTLCGAYESPQWEAAGRKCLGCGSCSFLCPTCYCFDIADEIRGGAGRRVKTWDCCSYTLFTLHASGHNPRPTLRERWRQRVMHKFRYSVESFAVPFCVGCGRCIRGCPVSMDVRTVLKELGA